MKQPFRRTYTMGDLPSAEARTFFFEHVLPSFPKALPGASDAWERVYEVCGGNPGLLRNVAGLALAMSWNEGELFIAAH
jgi:hypothetical protein